MAVRSGLREKPKGINMAVVMLMLVISGLACVAVLQRLLEKRTLSLSTSQGAQWIEEKGPAWHLQLDDVPEGTLALPAEPALQDALIDVDADGYLERTQWLATNQQVLAIDADGNNQIGVNELLSLDGPDSLHGLGWLDANGDQMLTDRDPAFAALRLWMDVNADADSSGETQTMAQAGIVAIDFGSHPPAVVRVDGSREALTVSTMRRAFRTNPPTRWKTRC